VLFSLLNAIFKRPSRTDGDRSVESLMQRAQQLHHEGDVAGARELCRAILSRSPRHARAHCLLGVLCGQSGELDRAVPYLQQAIELAPDLADAHLALGNVHKLRGDGPLAETSYRNAVACDPDSPTAHYSLALVLNYHGQHEAALRHLDLSCSLAPAFDDAIRERVLCLIRLERYEEAVSFLMEVTARLPDSAPLQACLGFAWQEAQQPAKALTCYERAQRLGHVDAELFKNLGIVLQQLGRIEEALGAYDQAIVLQPDNPLAKFDRALARLLSGNYAAGWPDYELRLISEDRPPRPALFPRWENQPLAGRSILVHGEQGLGDEIMFASCLPQVVAQADRCLISCSSKLERIFRRSFPEAEIFVADAGGRLPPEVGNSGVDFEVPAGSLPLYLRRSWDDFPAHGGYLRADAQRVDYWRRRLDGLGPGLKVGISWQGGTHKTRGPLRSIPLTQWLPVLRTPGIRWVSLQYAGAGAALAEIKAEHGIEIAHWQDAVDDYDETAALVGALDLVLSVDTALVHLSGALGKATWVMVPYSPEWRYGFAGDSMPWYPSVRIVRQPSYQDWDSVISRVAQNLKRSAVNCQQAITQ